MDESKIAKRIVARMPRQNSSLNSLVSKVSSSIEWGIEDAYIFCVMLLEDVNAHKESVAVHRLLSAFYDDIIEE